MAVLLEAGYDLGGLALCYVCIALLLLALELSKGVAGLLDFKVLGVRPLHGLAAALNNTVVRVLNSTLHDVETVAAKFESGLVGALELLIGLTLLVFVGIYDALSYFWSALLRPLIHSIVDPVADIANAARAKVAALEDTVANDLSRAERYADGQAAGALATAKAYADHWIDHAVSSLNDGISAALATAERYADTAVAKLRSAEDAAVANALGIAGDAKAAGVAAAAGALATAEHEIAAAAQTAVNAAAGALTTAEQYADQAERAAEAAATAQVASLDAAAQTALQQVRSIAIDATDDLHVIEGAIGAAGVGALIASIPALATIVNAIATEAGLENQSCRGKVKDICRTDPSAWENLLGGLAPLGLAFSLAELAAIARPLVGELAPIVAQAA